MGIGDRVTASVGMHSIDLTPEGRPDVTLSLPVNDIGYMESAEVLEEYMYALNCALRLARRHLRLVEVLTVGGAAIVFKNEPSFDELAEIGDEGDEGPEEYIFVFEAIPNMSLQDRHMMP
ncbi:MAG: hypothetical protein AAB608_02605 [Patescibacteria group bacterium]